MSGMFKRPTQCIWAFQYKKTFQCNQILQPGHGCISGSWSSLWTVAVQEKDLEPLPKATTRGHGVSPKAEGLRTPGKRISSLQLGDFWNH